MLTLGWMTVVMAVALLAQLPYAIQRGRWGLTVMMAGLAVSTLAPALWVAVAGMAVAVVGVVLAARDARRAA